jgi:hypothetical protein
VVAGNDPKAIRLMNSLNMGNLSTKILTRSTKPSLHNFFVVGSSIVKIATKKKKKSQEEEIMIP